MTALATAPETAETLGTLTRCEIARFLRHPVFLFGTFGLIITQGHALREPAPDVNSLVVSPVVFVSIAGLITAFALTHSMQSAAETLDLAPVSMQVRTTALCLTSIVPFSVGLITTAVTLAFAKFVGDWPYATFSTFDRVGIVSSQIAVAALGAPLLGVALARWVRYPWTGLVLLLGMVAWIQIVEGIAANYHQNVGIVALRMFAPYTFFNTQFPEGNVAWPGSPWAFVGWQLCLCAVATIVALLRGASPAVRRRLLQLLGAVLAVSAVMFALAVTGGLDHSVLVYPDGIVRSV
jgi:hypothetical protein